MNAAEAADRPVAVLEALLVEHALEVVNDVAAGLPAFDHRGAEPILVVGMVEVDQNQLTVALQDAHDFVQRFLVVRVPRKCHRVDDRIERFVGVRQVLDVALCEVRGQPLLFQVGRGGLHHVGVIVDSVGIELARVPAHQIAGAE